MKYTPGLRLIQRLVRDVHDLLQDGVNVLLAALTVRCGCTLAGVYRAPAHAVVLGHEHALRGGVHHAPRLIIHAGRHNTSQHTHNTQQEQVEPQRPDTTVTATTPRVSASGGVSRSAPHTPPSQPRGQQRLTAFLPLLVLAAAAHTHTGTDTDTTLHSTPPHCPHLTTNACPPLLLTPLPHTIIQIFMAVCSTTRNNAWTGMNTTKQHLSGVSMPLTERKRPDRQSPPPSHSHKTIT